MYKKKRISRVRFKINKLKNALKIWKTKSHVWTSTDVHRTVCHTWTSVCLKQTTIRTLALAIVLPITAWKTGVRKRMKYFWKIKTRASFERVVVRTRTVSGTRRNIDARVIFTAYALRYYYYKKRVLRVVHVLFHDYTTSAAESSVLNNRRPAVPVNNRCENNYKHLYAAACVHVNTNFV